MLILCYLTKIQSPHDFFHYPKNYKDNLIPALNRANPYERHSMNLMSSSKRIYSYTFHRSSVAS